MTDEGDVLERLEVLGRATEGVGPRPGFSARVMSAVDAQSVSWFGQVVGMSWRLLPVATVLAVLACAWALQVDGELDDAMAASYGVMEVEW